jgi:predicted RNA-binding protein with PIN domain
VSYHRIFVDGHSVIHGWPELVRIHRRASQKAREELLTLLIQFQDATHIPVTLVFDGGKRMKPSTEPTSLQPLELLYSEPGETADAVIERRVAALERGTKVVVVTNDRVEQMTVESFGAEAMSAESFVDWIERERQQFGHRLEAIHRRAAKYRKFQ